VSIYLQTRGRTIDYTFLGQAPGERWWSQYRNVTAFEDPTILVHADGSSWKACVSGIPSARKDRIGTTIRYTLVLEGETADAEGRASALAVVATWLDDLTQAEPSNRLAEALDGEFTEEFVEDVINDREVGRSAGMVAKKLASAMERLPIQTFEDLAPIPYSWVGAKEKPRPRAAFLRRVHDLLRGQGGRALFVNLIETQDEARGLAQQGEIAAILIEDGAETLGSDVVSIEKKKPVLTYPSQDKPRQDKRNSVGLMWLLIGIILILVLLWFLFSPSP
jgi:hypothetical protein